MFLPSSITEEMKLKSNEISFLSFDNLNGIGLFIISLLECIFSFAVKK